jgi:RNA polymerase primary sigma factor
MIAAEKYDYRLGHTFGTYAQWWIRQSITRAIMDSGFIRIPVHMEELLLKVRRAMNEIALREKRPPTISEVAEAIEEDPKKVKQALRVARLEVSSLNAAASDTLESGGERFDGADEQLELIADETALRADHILEAREELDAACARLNDLTDVLYEEESISDRHKEFFVRFYGLDGSLRRRTLEHVAEGHNVTREAVRIAIARVWDKLQLAGCDKDHDSVVEELARIQELEKLANRRVSAS